MIEANKENPGITSLFFVEMKKRLDLLQQNKEKKKKKSFLFSRFLGEEEIGSQENANQKRLRAREPCPSLPLCELGEATFVETTTFGLRSQKKTSESTIKVNAAIGLGNRKSAFSLM